MQQIPRIYLILKFFREFLRANFNQFMYRTDTNNLTRLYIKVGKLFLIQFVDWCFQFLIFLLWVEIQTSNEKKVGRK